VREAPPKREGARKSVTDQDDENRIAPAGFEANPAKRPGSGRGTRHPSGQIARRDLNPGVQGVAVSDLTSWKDGPNRPDNLGHRQAGTFPSRSTI
jgi:hypothetical protein